MAIIDHVEVKILVDGEPATEINDEESLEQHIAGQITKYIEVRSDVGFAFRFRVLPSYQAGEGDGLAFRIAIDGKVVCGISCMNVWINPVTGWTITVDSQYSGGGTDIKKLMYRFADLETRDTCEADLVTLKEKYSKLGSLKVEVWPVRSLGYVERAYINHPTRDEEIPEKALKGRAIAVATQMEVAPMSGTLNPYVHDVRLISIQPIAIFEFQYRTRAALQAEMIIPRSPSPVDAEEIAVENLTPEEMREIIRRQREHAVKIEDDAPRIKRERPLSSIVPLRPMKTTKTSDGRTLYHLDSDNEEEDESTVVEQEPEPVEIIDLLYLTN